MKSIRNGNKCEIGEEGNGGGGEGRGLANARMPRKSFLVFSRWRARGWPRHVVLKTDYHVVCHRAGSEQERGNRKKKRERERERKRIKRKSDRPPTLSISWLSGTSSIGGCNIDDDLITVLLGVTVPAQLEYVQQVGGARNARRGGKYITI